jgi:hypothetical protein
VIGRYFSRINRQPHNLDGPEGSYGQRRVKYVIRAWKLRLPEADYSIPLGPIEAVGEPAMLEPFDEIQFLCWTSNSGDIWALILRRDSLFLITQDDFAQNTVRALL